MPHVRFTKTFLWSPPELKRRFTVRYLAGKTYLVTRACWHCVMAAQSGYLASRNG